MLSARPASALYRENLHNENAPRFNGSKTPGRALKGRTGLQENIIHNGYATADPKEKRNGAKTPFRPDSVHDLSSMKPQAILAPRPLVDKTPLPNRQLRHVLHTPLTNAGKISKLPLPALIDEQEDHTTPPPSSSRKKLRIPRNSIKFLQTTPITKGDHWNVSDISIELANSSLGDVAEEDVNEPDHSEPEYMPPTAIDAPYEPPFTLPNYKEVGSNLMRVARSYVVEQDKQNIIDFEATFDDSMSRILTLDAGGIELPSLEEDDPFIVAARSVKPPRTKPTNTGATQSNIRTRSMVNSKASGAVVTNRAVQPQARNRPATSMQARRTVHPGSSSNSSARPATALSSTSKSTVQRRAEPVLKKLALASRKEISGEIVLRFSDTDCSTADSDFRFSL